MIKYLLAPAAGLYYAAYLIDKAFARSVAVAAKVVSVGNLTWGGSGKTPLAVKIASDLLASGARPAYILRGYRRKLSSTSGSPLVVSDGRRTLVSVEESGDEAFLAAEQAKGIPVIVSPDRAAAAVFAVEKYAADVAVLDDGFQHWRIKRDLDVVCVDAVKPFGNGMLIPAGNLREPLSALRRAGLIVITNADLVSTEEVCSLEKKISGHTSAPVAHSALKIAGYRNVTDGSAAAPDFSRAAVVFSALGSNENFFFSVGKTFRNLAVRVAFADHHWYTADDLRKIYRQNPGALFVTTHKDAVKIKRLAVPAGMEMIYPEVAPEIIQGERHWQNALKRLCSTETAR